MLSNRVRWQLRRVGNCSVRCHGQAGLDLHLPPLWKNRTIRSETIVSMHNTKIILFFSRYYWMLSNLTLPSKIIFVSTIIVFRIHIDTITQNIVCKNYILIHLLHLEFLKNLALHNQSLKHMVQNYLEKEA